MDVPDIFAEIPVCTAYQLDGELCEEVRRGSCAGPGEPVYEVHEGSQQPAGGARRLADLATAARALPRPHEALSGTGVRYVSVGSRRDQIIEV